MKRFWSKVDIQELEPSSCWVWTRGLCRGYGQFWFEGDHIYAHVWAYERRYGPVPGGMELDHTCRIPSCVNPEHLEPVTHQENMKRGHWGRKAHCPQGHPYAGGNLYVYPHGSHRGCRICSLEATHRYRERKRRGTPV